jgi:hypothetical protein
MPSRVMHAPSFRSYITVDGSEGGARHADGGAVSCLTSCFGSVRNTPVELSDTEAAKIFDSSKASIHEELGRLHAAAAKQRGVADKNMGLAAYLTARSTVHQTIDGDELRHLRKANDSVNKARELLSHGRGNVTTDLAKSQEPYWRTAFGRRQSAIDKADAALSSAMAVKMGAGNCGEHAWVTTAVHAGKLDIGETVQTVRGADGFDHAWSEAQLPGGDRLIMDAWAEGPALMAEDSAFSFRPDRRDVIASLNRLGGRIFAQNTQNHLNRLKVSRELDSAWTVFKEEAKETDLKIDAAHVWAPTAVLHEHFKLKVRNQQQSAEVRAALLKEGMDVKYGINARIALGRELKAVGTARALGANVQQALDAKEQITDAMDRQNASRLRGPGRGV